MLALEKKIVAEFETVLRHGLNSEYAEARLSTLSEKEQEEYIKRESELHPSSLPYCGLRHGYEKLVREKDPVVFSSFSDQFFVNVGKIAHTLFQRWIGKSGRIWGNWVCIECEKKYKLQVHPEECKCGSTVFRYKEIGGVWGENVHWHKDGMFQTKSRGLWVIDYKTSTASAIYKHKRDGNVYPYKENKYQVEAYTVLVEDLLKKKGIKADIRGFILVYISRDAPNYAWQIVPQVVDKERRQVLRERMKRDDKTFSMVLGIKKNKELIPKLVKTKLCPDKQFYKDNVESKYNPCPLAKHCWTKEKITPVMDAAFKGIPIKVKS